MRRFCLILLVGVLLLSSAGAYAAPLATGRTVTVSIPAGETLHAYPEASSTAPVYVRCVGARTWRIMPNNGKRLSCQKVVLKSAAYFDVGFE